MSEWIGVSKALEAIAREAPPWAARRDESLREWLHQGEVRSRLGEAEVKFSSSFGSPENVTNFSLPAAFWRQRAIGGYYVSFESDTLRGSCFEANISQITGRGIEFDAEGFARLLKLEGPAIPARPFRVSAPQPAVVQKVSAPASSAGRKPDIDGWARFGAGLALAVYEGDLTPHKFPPPSENEVWEKVASLLAERGMKEPPSIKTVKPFIKAFLSFPEDAEG